MPPPWAEPPPAAQLPRRRRRFARAAAAAVLLGLLLGSLAWLRPAPAPLAAPFALSEYRSPLLPPAAWAAGDLRLLDGAGLTRRSVDTFGAQESAALRRELGGLASAGRGPLVVWLQGYARAAPGGGVLLMAADADPASGAGEVPLEELLAGVAASPSARVLVLLDLHEPTDSPAAGVPRSDVAARVGRALEAARLPKDRVTVVASASAGERALAAGGRTPFGAAVARGLAGAGGAVSGGDRRVTVRELAAFASARVPVLSAALLGRVQSPQVWGVGPDFALAVVPAVPAADAVPEAAPAPAWLAAGWADLAGAAAESPRLRGQWRAALLRAGAVAAGPDPARAEADYRYIAGLVAARRRPVAATAAPPAALAAVANELLGAARSLAAADRPAGEAKALAAFAAAAKGATDAAVEAALWGAAPSAEGERDLLRLLDAARKGHHEPPATEGGRFLALWGSRAADPATWPADLARRSVAAETVAQSAFARPELVAWARPLLDQCRRTRDEGVALLMAGNAVDPDVVAERFGRVGAEAARLERFARQLAEARGLADGAAAEALPTLALLDEFPERETLWSERLAAAGRVWELLAAPAGAVDLPGRGEALRRVSDELRQTEDGVRGGPAADVVALALARLKSPDAEAVRQVAALRDAFFWSAEHRATLDGAIRGARAALAKALPDDRGTQPPPPPVDASARSREARRAARQVRGQVAVLQWAGLPADATGPLAALSERLSREGPDSPAWDDATPLLRAAWNGRLLEQLRAADPDRAAAVAPFLIEPAVDAPGADPRRRAEQQAVAAHRAWLAEGYRDRVDAGLDAASAEAALADVERQDAPAPPVSPWGVVAKDGGILVTGSGPPAGALRAELLPPAVGTVVLEAVGTNGLPARIRLEWGASGPPAEAVALVRDDRRSRVVRLVSTLPATPSLQLIVRRTLWGDADAGDRLALRPTGTDEPLTVALRNVGPKPRAVTVRVTLPGGTAEAKVTAPPAGEVPVPLAGAGGVAELPAVLSIIVVNEGGAAELSRSVVLAPADPREYAELITATFRPATDLQPANRLEVRLRARRDPGPVPLPVELRLDRVPGLLGVPVAGLRGVLPRSGEPITLFAERLRLDPNVDDVGRVDVIVDGSARLPLRLQFPPFGDPVAATALTQPEVQLDAAVAPGGAVTGRVAAAPAPGDATLRVRLLRDDDGVAQTEREATFPTARRRSVAVGWKAGALTLRADEGDWPLRWELPGTVGPRRVRAELLSVRGAVLASAEQWLAVDATPPSGPAFVKLPQKLVAGAVATLRLESSDSESGLRGVRVFVGKPADGKPPPGAAVVEASPVPGLPAVWEAKLPLPGDRFGPVDLSAVAENGAGLTSAATKSAELVKELPPEQATLTGVVLEGNRPQPALEVRITPAAGGEATTVRTDERGAFRAAGLKPGKYVVTVSKSSTNRSARAEVTLRSGQVANVSLPLTL